MLSLNLMALTHLQKSDKLAILVHTSGQIEPECETALRRAESLGFFVWRNHTKDSVAEVKGYMVQEVLNLGFTEILWVEPNIIFSLKTLTEIRALKKPVFSALYSTRGTKELCGVIATHDPETKEITLSRTGSGFLYTRASVYLDLVAKLRLEKCSYLGKSFYPWFLPTVHKGCYLSEATAFCHRLTEAKYAIEAHQDLTVSYLSSAVCDFSFRSEQSSFFLSLPQHESHLIDDHQEAIDTATALSVGKPYKRIWTSVQEIPKVLLAQGSACAYNPSIVKHQDKLWMFYRHDAKTTLHCTTWQERRPIMVRAVMLDEKYLPIEGTDQQLILPSSWDSMCMEDPKVMSDGDFIWVSLVEPNLAPGFQSRWVLGVNVSKHVLENGKFRCLESGMPRFGKNPGLEKNWAPFKYGGQVMVNYSMSPHVVFNLEDLTEKYETPGVSWNMGEIIHGGTPPVLVGNEYFSFMHGKSEYTQLLHKPVHYMVGCVAFEARPPFKITRFTTQPILWSDLSIDPYRPISCAFPGGAIYDAGIWTVSYGHNDMACRLLTLTHKNLLSVMGRR